MELICSSKMSVLTRVTCHHNPEDSILQNVRVIILRIKSRNEQCSHKTLNIYTCKYSNVVYLNEPCKLSDSYNFNSHCIKILVKRYCEEIKEFAGEVQHNTAIAIILLLQL
jgi:hypothetical protein